MNLNRMKIIYWLYVHKHASNVA